MRTGNEEKRIQIIDSAIEVFASQGYYGASIKDITDKARISSGTFYLYFKGKDDLVLTIFEMLNARMEHDMSEKAKEKYDSGLSRFVACTCFICKKFLQHKELSTILLTRTIGISKAAEAQYINILDKTCSFFGELIMDIEGSDIIDLNFASKMFVQSIGAQAVIILPCKDKNHIFNCLYNLLAYNLRAMSVQYSEDQLKKLIKTFMDDQNY